MTKSLRPGKIFLDWSQNVAAKTTICPYSLRGKETPTVAAPRSWDEVEAGAEGAKFEQLMFDEVLDRLDVRRRPRSPTCWPSRCARPSRGQPEHSCTPGRT